MPAPQGRNQAVPTCPRGPVPSCPRARVPPHPPAVGRLAPSAMCALRPRRHHRPGRHSLFLPCSYHPAPVVAFPPLRATPPPAGARLLTHTHTHPQPPPPRPWCTHLRFQLPKVGGSTPRVRGTFSPEPPRNSGRGFAPAIRRRSLMTSIEESTQAGSLVRETGRISSEMEDTQVGWSKDPVDYHG